MVARYPFFFALTAGTINFPSTLAATQRTSVGVATQRTGVGAFLERAGDPWWDQKSLQTTETFNKDYVRDRNDLSAMKRFEAENKVTAATHQLEYELRKLKEMEATHQQNENKIRGEGEHMQNEKDESEKHKSISKQAEGNAQEQKNEVQKREYSVAEKKACVETLEAAEQKLVEAQHALAKAKAKAGAKASENSTAPNASKVDYEAELKQIDEECKRKHDLLEKVRQAQAVVDEKKVCAGTFTQAEQDLAKAQAAHANATAGVDAAAKSALKEEEDITRQGAELDKAEARGEESANDVSAQKARVERAEADLEKAKKELAAVPGQNEKAHSAHSGARTSRATVVAAVTTLVALFAMPLWRVS